MRNRPGAALGLTGRTIVGSVLTALLVAAALAILIAAIETLRTDSSRANHSQQVVSTANRLEGVLLDIETGSRGYVITRQESFLQPWSNGRRTFPPLARRLVQIVSGETQQTATARAIQTQGAAYIRDYSVPLVATARRNPQAARSAVASGEGKRRTDALRALFARLTSVEQHLAVTHEQSARHQGAVAVWVGGVGLALSLLAIFGVAAIFARTVVAPIRRFAETTRAIAGGDLSARVPQTGSAEVGELATSFNQMAAALDEHDWLTRGERRLVEALQGKRHVEEAAQAIVDTLAPLAGAERAVYLHLDAEAAPPTLRTLAVVGGEPDARRRRFAVGEGLPGQAAADGLPRWLDPPPGYAPIESALGSAVPVQIGLIPVVLDGRTLAVLELASFEPFDRARRHLVEAFAELAGPALATIAANTRTQELLAESQRQAATLLEQAGELQAQSEELQSQSEELRATNEELGEQTQALQASEEELQVQQEELQRAYRDLQETASSLSESSRYKSEFLANMSHELRTPLNSLLILARLLAENAEGNLTPKQIQFAETVHDAGVDLLALINDILDLSKIEAGRLDVSFAAIDLEALADWAERFGRPLADQNGLVFRVEVVQGTPQPVSDDQRLQQILANLLGNAFKFTESGEVVLRIGPAGDDHVEMSVTDTGIGIPEAEHDSVFDAFRQGDGGTSRRFGGTGLGLSISRQLAGLLGAELTLQSTPGAGSTFSLRVPTRDVVAPAPPPALAARPPRPTEAVPRRVLVVEDDARTVEALKALLESDSVIVLAAHDADAAVALLDTNEIDCLLLDLGLGGADGGFELLRRLELRGRLPDLPVVVHTGQSLSRGQEVELLRVVDTIVVKDAASPARLRDEVSALLAAGPRRSRPAAGSDGFLAGRTVFVVDDDVRNIFALTSLLERHGASVRYAENGREALERLADDPQVDIVLMDVMMPELDGHETTRALRADVRFRSVPVIALTAKAMPGDRELAIAAGASDYISKPVENDRLLSLLRVWSYDR
jgi:two-component system chemotaxis sensor kinase CheA